MWRPKPHSSMSAAHTELDAPLSGIPIGIKDVIDVAAMPTGYGANLPAQRLAEFDLSLRRDAQACGRDTDR